MKVSDSLKIIDYVGAGSFGNVYIGIDHFNRMVAVKVEDLNSKHSKIEKEYKIYKHMKKYFIKEGLPQVYCLIKTPKYNIMLMELLGQSLEDLYEEQRELFEFNNILHIGYSILCMLECFHLGGYVHRDVKPSNFLLGINKPDIYMVDFGLSKKYIHSGIHINPSNDHSLVGTARYASIYLHNGLEPSRRDDLISLGYMLIFFVKQRLPWQGVARNKDFLEHVGRIKESISIEQLCYNIDPLFNQYLTYCYSLQFDQQPDYDYLKNLFQIKN